MYEKAVVSPLWKQLLSSLIHIVHKVFNKYLIKRCDQLPGTLVAGNVYGIVFGDVSGELRIRIVACTSDLPDNIRNLFPKFFIQNDPLPRPDTNYVINNSRSLSNYQHK